VSPRLKALLIWAVVAVGVKLGVNYLGWSGIKFFRTEVPILVNTLIFAGCGFALGCFRETESSSFLFDRTQLDIGKPVLVLIIMLHPAVYLSGNLADYFHWTAQIAQDASITREAAASERDQFLIKEVGHGGIGGYFLLLARRPARPATADDVPDDAIDIAIWAIPRLLQWGARSLELRIDGIIDLVYWYLVAVLLTIITASWLGKLR